MWAVLIANVFNAAANYVLIFGALGVPAMGLVGAGIASGLTRGFMLLVLVYWVRAFRLHVGAWRAPGRHLLERGELLRVLVVGAAVAVQLGLEIWAFSGSTLLAGLIDPVSLAAHTIALNLAALAFMMPLGIAHGAAIRVGNLIGAGDPAAAQHAALVAMAFGGGVMTVSAVLFVTMRHVLPLVYTGDPLALAAAAAVLPIAGAFQIFDGVQVVGCGVLRGMGRTRPAAWFNFVGYWVVGLPLGATLALRRGLGLPGIWWGLALGLLLVASLLVIYIVRKGPAHAEPV
jgi:MATE family multidrug resistance protein